MPAAAIARAARRIEGVLPAGTDPGVMRELDEWLRHRLRAVRLKQWRSGPAVFRELRALGASTDLAVRIAGNVHRWWHNSRLGVNRVLPVAYFDRLGVPRFS